MSNAQRRAFVRHLTEIRQKGIPDSVEMTTSTRTYESMYADAGIRPESEIGSWRVLAHWFVNSQLALIDRHVRSVPREWSLRKAVEYAAKNPSEFSDEAVDASPAELRLRQSAGRAAWGRFSQSEGERDLATLDAIWISLQELRASSTDRWTAQFASRCENEGWLIGNGFRLPAFNEIELAVDALFALFVKYAELYGEKRFSVVLSVSVEGPDISPVAADWDESRISQVASEENSDTRSG